MAKGYVGHGTQIKDLVREFQAHLVSSTITGNKLYKTRQAHTIVTSAVNAGRLREIAAIGTDTSLGIDEKIKKMQALVVETLQDLNVRERAKPHEIDTLMRTLREVLDTPNLDVEYELVTTTVLSFLDEALGGQAAGAQPHAADPLDYLRRRIRQVIVQLRYRNYTIDAVCDRINIAVGFQWCLLGLPDDSLPDLTGTIDQIQTLLERAQKRLT